MARVSDPTPLYTTDCRTLGGQLEPGQVCKVNLCDGDAPFNRSNFLCIHHDARKGAVTRYRHIKISIKHFVPPRRVVRTVLQTMRLLHRHRPGDTVLFHGRRLTILPQSVDGGAAEIQISRFTHPEKRIEIDLVVPGVITPPFGTAMSEVHLAITKESALV